MHEIVLQQERSHQQRENLSRVSALGLSSVSSGSDQSQQSSTEKGCVCVYWHDVKQVVPGGKAERMFYSSCFLWLGVPST